MRTRCFAIVSFALATSLGGLFATDYPASLTATSSPTPAPGDLLNNINFDRALSGVPAFDALGLSPESVSSPTTPRELATDLINGVDHNGVLQHGLAIEVAPYQLRVSTVTQQEYAAEGWNGTVTRWLYDFSVSLATSKASSGSDAVQLALGFKEVLLESADHDAFRNPDIEAAAQPIRDYYHNWVPHPSQPLPPDPPQQLRDEFKNAVADFQKNSWQGTIWTAAIAPTWNSESGKLSNLTSAGFTAWSTFAYGLKQDKTHPLRISPVSDPINLQFIAQLRYREDEQVIDPNNKNNVASQNSFISAARLRAGTDTFNGFAEGAYVHVWHGLNGDGTAWRGAAGVEKKITENLWLVLSAGEQFGEATAKTNDLFVTSSLRLGTADKSQFGPQ